MKTFPRLLSILGLCLLSSTACTQAGDHVVSGVVLDYETKKPIEGAIVVIQWTHDRSQIVESRSMVCFHVETAVTDAEGRFKTPAWHSDKPFQDWLFTSDEKVRFREVYKEGMTVKEGEGNPPQRIYMEQFSGSKSESVSMRPEVLESWKDRDSLVPFERRARLHNLFRYFYLECGKIELYRPRLRTLNRAVVAEARRLTNGGDIWEIYRDYVQAWDEMEFVGGDEYITRKQTGYYNVKREPIANEVR